MTATALPHWLVLAGAPDAPGASAWIAAATRLAAGGAPLRAILTGPGLAWRDDPRLAALAEGKGVAVRACSQSAREQAPMDPLWGLFP